MSTRSPQTGAMWYHTGSNDGTKLLSSKQRITTSPKSALSRRWARRLATIRGVRSEMARVYAEAREGHLDWTDATRAVFILTAIYRVHTGSTLEERLEQLEQRADTITPPTNGHDRRGHTARH